MHSMYVHHMQSAILIYIVHKIVVRDRIRKCMYTREKTSRTHKIKMKYEASEK